MSDETSRDTLDSLLALHASSAESPGEAAWLDDLRSEGLAAFREQGVPTRRLEAWKGTNLGPLQAMRFGRVGPGASTSAPLSFPDAVEGRPELVFVDGAYDAARSRVAGLPSGCRLLPLAEAMREIPDRLRGRLGQLTDPKHQALDALQTAFLADGAVLLIERGTVLADPIRLRFLATGAEPRDDEESASAAAAFPRLLVVADEQSRATIHLSFESVGTAPGLTACVSELHLGPAARIDLVEVQAEDPERIHYSSVHARLERDARLDSHVFTLGRGLTRSEIEVTLVEPGAETRLRGFFLGRESGHVDHYTTVDHAADHCTSDEEYRGVLDGRSEGVFRGRVIVRPDAQKTDARQSNPNLLVSRNASVDSKPQLEIYADDVRASHGSTTGQLDADALFFLRSRGVGLAEARLLLTRAFARSIVFSIENESIRERIAEQVDESLASLEGDAPDIPSDRLSRQKAREKARRKGAERTQRGDAR